MRKIGADFGFVPVVVGGSTIIYALTLLVSGSRDTTALVWNATGLGPAARGNAEELVPDGLERLWADIGGPAGADCCGVVARHHLLYGRRIRERGFDGSFGEAALDEAAALAQRLWVCKEDLDGISFRTGLDQQVVLDRQDRFVLDGQRPGAVHEDVERLSDGPLEAVFDWDDTEIGHSRIDGARYGGDACHRH